MPIFSGGSVGARILGPFTVSYNDAGIVSPAAPPYGKTLTALRPGMVVLNTWVEVLTDFFGASSTSVNLQLWTDGDGSTLGDFEVQQAGLDDTGADVVHNLQHVDATHTLLAADLRSGVTEAFGRLVPARVRVACNLACGVYPDVGGLTQGQARVYALIA